MQWKQQNSHIESSFAIHLNKKLNLILFYLFQNLVDVHVFYCTCSCLLCIQMLQLIYKIMYNLDVLFKDEDDVLMWCLSVGCLGENDV
jgi:hypothetical protein